MIACQLKTEKTLQNKKQAAKKLRETIILRVDSNGLSNVAKLLFWHFRCRNGFRRHLAIEIGAVSIQNTVIMISWIIMGNTVTILGLIYSRPKHAISFVTSERRKRITFNYLLRFEAKRFKFQI